MSETKTFHISVKEEHIKQGKRSDYTSCPIALAIAEQVPNANRVYVSAVHTNFKIKYESVWYKLPLQAIKFIDKFDQSKTVEPFEFDLSELV